MTILNFLLFTKRFVATYDLSSLMYINKAKNELEAKNKTAWEVERPPDEMVKLVSSNVNIRLFVSIFITILLPNKTQHRMIQ